MTQASNAGEGSSDFAPGVSGVFILPNSNDVVEVARVVGNDAASLRDAAGRTRLGIIVETITGGVPDASDQLPDGTIIVSP